MINKTLMRGTEEWKEREVLCVCVIRREKESLEPAGGASGGERAG